MAISRTRRERTRQFFSPRREPPAGRLAWAAPPASAPSSRPSTSAGARDAGPVSAAGSTERESPASPLPVILLRDRTASAPFTWLVWRASRPAVLAAELALRTPSRVTILRAPL